MPTSHFPRTPHSPRTPRVPTYRLHKPSGRAVVTLGGRDVYLGAYGSPESKAEYDRVLAEWMTGGRSSTATPANQPLSVGGLILAYWTYAEKYYKTKTLDGSIRPSMRRLRALYGHTPAADFGPLALKALRETMLQEKGRSGNGLARTYINAQIKWIKTCFRWGVAEGLVPPAVIQGLDAVNGLKRGRTEARETRPIGPVRDQDVEAALPHMPPVVADMVRVQRLSGMRPGELCAMTTGALEMSDDVWLYRLIHHKTAHHGHERVVPIGPQAQAILQPYLRPELDRALFSPADSETQRHAQRRKNRQTPLTPSQRRRDRNRARHPKKVLNDWYEVNSYLHAIQRACDSAGIPRWSPNQLRHARATELRKQFGLDAASAVLGHKKVETTQIYAERNQQQAVLIAKRTG